jgi:general secretion pathway protein I
MIGDREWVTQRTSPDHSHAGFSILEVMIAVAILGLALTAIFSSEAGAIRMANRANKTAVAALLARCKMGEIEEQLAKEGLPAISEEGSDDCCEDGPVKDFGCQWKVSRILLPDANLDSSESPFSELKEGQPTQEGIDEAISKAIPPKDGASPILDEQSFQAGDITQMALQYVYPLLQPTIEEQVRRVDVTIEWKEGNQPMSFSVVQYLVASNPTPIMPPQEQEQQKQTPEPSPSPDEEPTP